MEINWLDWFYYDESSKTHLRWAVDRYGGAPENRILVMSRGDVAGCISASGYGDIKLNGTTYKAHRIIYEMFKERIPEGMDLDHIDGNRLNNKPNNLRLCKDKINSQNRHKSKANSSGITGVTLMRNKGGNLYWKAHWMEEGKPRAKVFSVLVYGCDKARELAINLRQNKIKELNKQGQYYTERHGK